MIPTSDPATRHVLRTYHNGGDQEPPQLTIAEVERELDLDDWDAMMMGNGEYVPPTRTGKSRRPALLEGRSEDNR